MAVSIPVLVIVIALHLIAFVLAVGAERRRSTIEFLVLFANESSLSQGSIRDHLSISQGRVKAKVEPDKYDERTYCVYGTDASTAYGLAAFGLLLISQTLVNGITKCLCFGRGMMGGSSTTCAIFFFVFSWFDRTYPSGWPSGLGLGLPCWRSQVRNPLPAKARGLPSGSSSSHRACLVRVTSPMWVSFLGAEACLLAGSAKNAYHTKYRAAFQVESLSCATLRKGVFAAGAALTLLSMIGSIFYYWKHSKADTGGWQKHQNEGLGMAASNYTESTERKG
ncbi:hypothetical protein MTR67_021653 [Solanum verrucosum]|uniref:Uncharacterized protein n=1 Tax=Solanum verrucosum TaxID=315347 RepID=A0AAF0TX19_SOLVR|nr:hypothetical protein MTR67_021653 [Solanum verrucosum]